MMIDIVLEFHWSNNPIPIEQLVDEPDFIFEIPFGLITGFDAPVQSVNGKIGAVTLNHIDVDADPNGAAAEVRQELETVITELSNSKLDKLDYIQHFRGLFSSYAALTVALPTALDGDYAHIDGGVNFGRMAAIWDGDDNKWIINEVNAALNTDEMPEGNQNLYFKVDRVLQVPMTGLPVVAASEVLPTDVLLSVVAKLQAQIKQLKVAWVPIATVATVQPYVSVNNIELARIDGNLWIRGSFQLSANPGAADFITITDNNYKTVVTNAADFQFNRMGNIIAFHYENPITINYRISANRQNHTLQGPSGFGITTTVMNIQPTCIGKLMIQ